MDWCRSLVMTVSACGSGGCADGSGLERLPEHHIENHMLPGAGRCVRVDALSWNVSSSKNDVGLEYALLLKIFKKHVKYTSHARSSLHTDDLSRKPHDARDTTTTTRSTYSPKKFLSDIELKTRLKNPRLRMLCSAHRRVLPAAVQGHLFARKNWRTAETQERSQTCIKLRLILRRKQLFSFREARLRNCQLGRPHLVLGSSPKILKEAAAHINLSVVNGNDET
jgi:hypothetical protein